MKKNERIKTSLEIIRMRLVDGITEIDNQLDRLANEQKKSKGIKKKSV